MPGLPWAIAHPNIAGLHLRAFRTSDGAAFRAIVTRADVGRMLFAFPADWSLAQADAFVVDHAQPVTPPYRLAVADGSGALLGSVGFAAGAMDEIAFFLHPDHGGKGIMGAALPVFLTQVFATTDLPALRAVVYHDNAASRALLEKLGFVWVGRHVGTCSPRRCGAEGLDTLTLARATWATRANDLAARITR